MNQNTILHQCNYCDKLIETNGKSIGLQGVYKRPYEPWEFFEGKKNSLVWIVGINQAFNERKQNVNSSTLETKEELEDIFHKWKSEGNQYYKLFKMLNPDLYNWIGWEKILELQALKLLDVVLLETSQRYI
ncbi:hypothetical protein MPH47_09755 [Psychrobacillus psychrodurans]|uniref:hypothetical protein n=1 Tax=Psychrobacillus psychrodurans TaxID=126157 RepID=UPI001F4F0742|nr:hypothetical protein [Psychrobacillus psychrodurans]MCK1997501.1 hypothetical protein [Psychrobacillus psychrodurans]